MYRAALQRSTCWRWGHSCQVASVTGYDMFPSTLHVEALVRLELTA
jgi:hypothetical protein